MKKIKVIFPDGSVGEIDDKDWPDAKAAGVKMFSEKAASGKKISVVFPDGSEGEIDESDYGSALSAGVKKKEVSSKEFFAGSSAPLYGAGEKNTSANGTENTDQFSLKSIAGTAGGSSFAQYYGKSKKPLPVSENPYKQDLDRIIKDKSIPSADKSNAYAEYVQKNPVVSLVNPSFVTEEPEHLFITDDIKPKNYPGTSYEYAKDLQQRLSNPKNQEEFELAYDEYRFGKNVESVSSNDAIVTSKDMAEINRIIHEMNPEVPDTLVYDEINGDVISLLEKSKKKIIDNKRQEWENDPGNKITIWEGRGIAPKQKLIESKWKEPETIADKYIKKAQGSLQAESQYGVGGVAVVKSGDVQSDLQSILQGINPVLNAQKFNKIYSAEGVTPSMATGIESLKLENPVEYNRVINTLAKGGILSSTDIQKYKNRGAQIIDARNIEKVQNGEMTHRDYFNKRAEIQKEMDDNYYGRPDILQRNIANAISDYYETESIVRKWMITDKEIDAVPREHFSKYGIDIDRPESQSVIKNIKVNEGILPFDNAVRKDGLLREAVKGFKQPIEGTFNFIDGMFKDDDEKIADSHLQRITDYTEQRGEWFNKNYGGLADAFNGAGQLVSQILLMEAGAGAVGKIGSALGGTTGMTISNVTAGQKLGANLLRNKDLYGSLVVPYVQSYDSYYKEALEKTNDRDAASMYAMFNASMEAVSEKVFDNLEFGRRVVKDFSTKNYRKIAAALNNGDIDAAKKSIKSGLLESGKIIGKQFVDLNKEAAEESIVRLSNMVGDVLVNKGSVENVDVINELKNAYIGGLVSFSIPSIIGAGAKLKSKNTYKKADTNEASLYMAATNKEFVKEALDNMLADGNLKKDEYDAKVQMLNTAAQAVGDMPSVYMSGKEMSMPDRSKYLSLVVQGRYLDERAKNTTDEAVKKVNKEKSQALSAQRLSILVGTSEQDIEAAIKRIETGEKIPEEEKNLIPFLNDRLAAIKFVKAKRELDDRYKQRVDAVNDNEGLTEEQKEAEKEAIMKEHGQELIRLRTGGDKSTPATDGGIKLASPEDVESSIKNSIDEKTYSDASKFVNEIASSGIIPDKITSDAAIKNPLAFLQMVADQSLGYVRNSDGQRQKSKDPIDPKLEERYTNAVVDYAKELFPERQTEQVGSVVDEAKQPTLTEDVIKEPIQGSRREDEKVVGDFVQWTSQGVDMFETPRKITSISEDGQYAFVEGTSTGIPVIQLSKADISKPRVRTTGRVASDQIMATADKYKISIPDAARLHEIAEQSKDENEFRERAYEFLNSIKDNSASSGIPEITGFSVGRLNTEGFEDIKKATDEVGAKGVSIFDKGMSLTVDESSSSLLENKKVAWRNTGDQQTEMGRNIFVPEDKNSLYEILTGEGYTDEQRGMAAAHIAAHRLIGDNKEMFGRLFEAADGNIIIFSSDADQAKILAASPNGTVSINAYKLGQRFKVFRDTGAGENRFLTWLDNAIQEEVWHIVTHKNATREELTQIALELTPDERRAVIDLYSQNIEDLKNPEIMAAEYVRMVLQQMYSGTATEMFKPTMTSNLPDRKAPAPNTNTGKKNFFSKVLAFIKNAFNANPERKATEVINKIQDFVAGKKAVVSGEKPRIFKVDDQNEVNRVRYRGKETYVQKVQMGGDGGFGFYKVEKDKDGNWIQSKDQILGTTLLGMSPYDAVKTIMDSTDMLGVSDGGQLDDMLGDIWGREKFGSKKPTKEEFIEFSGAEQERQSSQSESYSFGDLNSGTDLIAAHPMKQGFDRLFKTDKTVARELGLEFSDPGSHYMSQIEMLQDGKDMIGMAQAMFGGVDIRDYGEKLFDYIVNQMSNDVALVGKKIVLTGTFLGEIADEINRTPGSFWELTQLYNKTYDYYKNLMNVSGRNLVAGKVLLLFRDKYMADIYHDAILEKDEMDDLRRAKEALMEDISDEQALDYMKRKQAGKTKEDYEKESEQKNNERKENKNKPGSRKKGDKDKYKKMAREAADEVKKKYGSNNAMEEKVKELLNKIKNCK